MGKYLITGGCGFIGSHLTHALVQLGHQVRVLDDLSYGLKENLPPEAEFIEGSILDHSLLKDSLQGIDGCFHLAAIVSVEQSTQNWASSHQINVLGTIHLLEMIRNLKLKIPFIYASSAAVYGHPLQLPIQEECSLSPLSPYGLDKMSCEQHASIGWNIHGVSSIGLRLFNVYGPKQRADSPYSGVISIFCNKMKRDEEITIFGTGEQRRDFIHVYDVVRFFVACLDQPLRGASLYNICTGRGCSLNQLVGMLELSSHKIIKKQYAAYRKGDILTSVGSPLKAEAAFQLKAQISLEDGLSHLIQNENDSFSWSELCVFSPSSF